MNVPGTLYKSSNKLNAVMIVPALLAGLAIALLTGYLYGLISHYNPFIYVNVLVLVGALGGVILSGSVTKTIAKSRNRFFDLVVMALLGYVAWHASWAYMLGNLTHKGFFAALPEFGNVIDFAVLYAKHNNMSVSRMGTHGIEIPQAAIAAIYIIEFATFFVPLFVPQSLIGIQYFCEHCGKHCTAKTYYSLKPDAFEKETNMARNGNLGFMRSLDLTTEEKTIKAQAADGQEILQANISNCDKCGDSAIVDLYSRKVKSDKKGKKELKSKKPLVRKTYFDKASFSLEKQTADT